MSLAKPEDVVCFPVMAARYAFDRLLRARLATTTRPGMVVISVAEYVSALARNGLAPTHANLNITPLYTKLGWTAFRTTSDYCLLAPQTETISTYDTEGLATPEFVLDVPRTALHIFDTILRQVLYEATPELDWHFVSLQRYKSALFVSLGATRAAKLDARWFQVDQAYTRTGLWSVRVVTDGDEDKQGYYFRPAQDEADGAETAKDEDPVLPFPFYALPAHVLRAVDAFIHACAEAGEMPVLSANALRTILDAPRMSARTADRVLEAIATEYKPFWEYEIAETDAGRVLRLLFPPTPAATTKPAGPRPVSPLEVMDGEPRLIVDEADSAAKEEEAERAPGLDEIGDDLPELA
jgi:hypothetical protein